MTMLMARRIFEGLGAPLSQITKMEKHTPRTCVGTFDTLK